MTVFLKQITGFYEYTKGIYRNMTANLRNMTGFHKIDSTVPAAVRHITQTARAEHNQSLREEPSSPSRLHEITLPFYPDRIFK